MPAAINSRDAQVSALPSAIRAEGGSMTDRDPAAGIVSLPSRRYVRVAASFTVDSMQPCPAALDPAPLPVPLIGRLVPAGFPSPADDYLEGEIVPRLPERLRSLLASEAA